jgi:NAD(P)-dependent dehydrogenase (short-subunit alcohol dehydrogenase family)
MKVALITGGSSGIGAATARELLERRWAVVLAARGRPRLEATAHCLARRGGAVLSIPADVSQPDQAEALVAQAAAWKGRLDAVINAAGAAPLAPLARLSAAQWRRILDTNLSAVFHTTRAAWPLFGRQHRRRAKGRLREGATGWTGTIVNISSEASRDPFAGLGAYGAAKAALNVLTRVIAREGLAIGVRAVAIAPGAVDTPMFRALPFAGQVAAEALLAPQDVAAAIVAALEGSLWCASGETIFIHAR